jgi:selenocysteine-specific elongation factor
MIVATAGHIDHGKTLLVKALTGIDADRLPEEKRRGMTIDLGFAYRHLDDGAVLGFVDVPGHERFVRNMLAGVGGIDFALLIVAADDGPMPQTEEHLAILDLLGIRNGAVAVTKIDRVTPARLDNALEEVQIMLDGTSLENAPVFPLSALTGDGVPPLLEHLEATARSLAARPDSGNFRLAVDRVFTVAGAGLVVTGTVYSGRVAIGDRLVLSPAGTPVRVRAIHAQNRDAQVGRAGERCALNLTGQGIGRDSAKRGDWVLAEPAHVPVRQLDATLRLLAEEKKPLRHWTPVHVHLAASAETGRVAILEGGSILPGEAGLVQIVLDNPVGALSGDRFILRDQSARRTIGGGTIVDPFSPARGRARPQRLEILRAMQGTSPEAALASRLAQSEDGIDLGRFAQTYNLTPDEADALWDRVQMVRVGSPPDQAGIAPAHWDGLCADIVATLRDWHAKRPDQPGPEENRLRRALTRRPSAALFGAAILDLLHAGRIARDGVYLTLPGHRAVFSAEDTALWEQVRSLLEEGDIRPPRVLEIAEAISRDRRNTERFLARVARAGLIHQVADNRFYLPETLLGLAKLATALAKESPEGEFSAADYNKRAGIGRNLTINLLEFFDRKGLTQRSGDGRKVVAAPEIVFGGAGS